MKHLLLILIILFSSPSVLSGLYSYECRINGEYTYGGNGELVSDKKIYAGGKFEVERKSGVVLGSGVGNSSYPTKQVLDPGGESQSYKLIWVSKDVAGTKDGKIVVYLSIQEFAEGTEKPFVLIAGSRTLSGTCK